ncbi:RDD family protein [Ostreibacterium oceani]|uniref:RDD family protein n=1 Tax=Ostreibacterium oceani TaxID=2654998 RepID=UPI001C40871E|nr:RDD family protein [Ostreibacterium oceani]
MENPYAAPKSILPKHATGKLANPRPFKTANLYKRVGATILDAGLVYVFISFLGNFVPIANQQALLYFVTLLCYLYLMLAIKQKTIGQMIVRTKLISESTADAFPADTFPADTFPADTFPADTFPADTFPADTFPADTFPADTFPTGTPPDGVSTTKDRHLAAINRPSLAQVFMRISPTVVLTFASVFFGAAMTWLSATMIIGYLLLNRQHRHKQTTTTLFDRFVGTRVIIPPENDGNYLFTDVP